MNRALIIGHGPSRKNLDFIRSFDGIRIAVSTAVEELLDAGIIPDYAMQLEVTIESDLDIAVRVISRLTSTNFVYRKEESPRILEAADKHNVHLIRFEMPSYVDNVGLFSIVYAQKILKIKELHLIGLEHRGDDYKPHIFVSWLNEFEKYICTESDKDCKIIDHSNGALTEPLERLCV